MHKSVLKHIFFFLALFVGSQMMAQTKLTGGPFVGTSWYNGDLNASQQFYRAHPAFGGLLRYAIKDRIAFRAQANIVNISGAYKYEGNYFPNSQNVQYSFKRSVVDLSAMMEINFFSFDHPFDDGARFSPYLAFGLGSTIYKSYKEVDGNRTEKPTFVLSLPFGAGVKWKVNRWVQMGAEWTFRKTFADDLDVVGFGNRIDASDPFKHNASSAIHNNDWYSVVGVYLSFQIFSTGGKCFDGF